MITMPPKKIEEKQSRAAVAAAVAATVIVPVQINMNDHLEPCLFP